MPAGKIGAPPFEGSLSTEYSLHLKGRLKSVEEFENIILRVSNSGAVVRMKDVVDVELGQLEHLGHPLGEGKEEEEQIGETVCD